MKELLQLMRGMACDLLALLLFGWIILRLRTLDSQLRVRIPLHVKAPGVLVMVLGMSLMSVCVVAFGLWGRGTPSLLAPTKQMVALGPYRYVRNPIHIGQVIFLGSRTLPSLGSRTFFLFGLPAILPFVCGSDRGGELEKEVWTRLREVLPHCTAMDTMATNPAEVSTKPTLIRTTNSR